MQSRQKLFRRRTQRIAEFHETIEARNGFAFNLKRHDGLVRLQIQLAQRIHEKCGAAADFIAQHGNARAGHVKSFNDDILQLVAQELLDGVFVFLPDLRIIGEHANGAEAGGVIAILARSKKFLDRVGGVGAVIQDLLDGCAARPSAGERIAGGAGLRGGFLLLVPKARNARLRVSHQFFQAAGALQHGLPMQIGGLRAFAMMQGFLKQLLLVLFVARHAFGVVREGLLGLRLIAVQARQFLAEFSGGAPQRSNAILDGIVGAGNFSGGSGQTCQNRFDARDIVLDCRDRFAVRGGPTFHLRSLRGGLLDFHAQLLQPAGQFRGALPIEKNSILAAIEFQRRLSENILMLAQLAFQFVRARRELFLLRFPLIYGLRFL